LQSHLKALRWAKSTGANHVAIFEDDIIFDNNFAHKLDYYLKQAPDNFCIMYLGGSFGRKPQPMNLDFTKQVMTWGAFAYIVNCDYVGELINSISMAKKITDAVYIDFQNKYVCIKPIKKLVTHPKGFSTIKNKDVDYKHIT
jgi:GR25 family glycosyltransferase involved in LPS biosynthesis